MARSFFLLFVLVLLSFDFIESSGDGELTTSNGDEISDLTTDSGSGIDETTVTTLMTTTETKSNASYDTPVVVQIADTLTDGKMTFYCDFTLSNESLWYTISWHINNHNIKRLGPFNSNVREQTKLLETSLAEKNAGFMISCAYQVAYTENENPSSETKSPQKFVGIQILSTDVSISDGEKGSITLQATAPIGCKSGETCSLGINIYNQDYSSSCYEPTTIFSECQVKLKADEWNKPFNLSVTSGLSYRYGTRTTVNRIQLQTQSSFPSHTMWENYNLGTVQVSVTQSTLQIAGKYCYAVCDPHMGTFERDHYEHQYLGKFTLYENKEWKQEIQVQTEPCFGFRNSRPYCVCGLAIRAGKEVYIMDKCSPRRYWSIKYVQCDPTRSGLINVVRRGSQYSITLPSGTVVETNLYTYMKFLNLYVYPSEGDVNNAGGLCGRVGSAGFYHRNGTEETTYNWFGMPDYSESWRIKDSVLDLFSQNDREKLDLIGNSVYQCKCANDPNKQSQVMCDKVDPSDCTIYFGRTRKVDDCKIESTSRKKRSIQHSVKKIEKKIVAEQHTLVKRNANGYAGSWNESMAEAYCDAIFTQSDAVQACVNVSGVDLASPKNNCVEDIMLEGGTTFTLTAIETIKSKCFKEVGQNSTLQNSTDGAISIIDKIKNIACPFDCNGHGSCQNGTCQCNENFGSDDCSIDLTKAPLGMVEYEDGQGQCDVRNCLAISVFGGPFVEGGSATCRIQSKVLMTNGSLMDRDNATIIPATIISIGEVSCTLSNSNRRKRATDDPEIDGVTVYEVSVSNGQSYSDSSLIVARHAECHKCEVNSTDVSCTYLGCYFEGICYMRGDKPRNDTDSCLTCGFKDGEPFWSRSVSDGNCETKATTPEKNLLWVIGAVLGGVALIVIIIIIIVVVIKKKNKRPVTPILQGE